jgi:putative phosphoesterase
MKHEIEIKTEIIMVIAFISDIHANLPALEAVLKDIESRQPDDIYCLGDLVNFAGWDNEVINLIREHDITCIQGNHDEGIGYQKADFPFSFKTEAQKEFGYASIHNVQKNISDENREFLCNLPSMAKFEFRFPFEPVKIALVHGSPSDNNEYIRPETDQSYLLELLDIAQADILLTGHTHRPFHKAIFCEEENRKLYRHVINAGSVGKPKHGNPLACYAMLEINRLLTLADPESVLVNFHYILYDTEKTIQHIHHAGLSHAYDELIRFGEYA